MADLQDQEVVRNYELLERLGIIDHMSDLNTQIKDLQDVVVVATELAQQGSLDQLLEFTVKRLVEKFIPASTLFILKEHYDSEKLRVVYYDKVRKVPIDLQLESIRPFQSYFLQERGARRFELFLQQFSQDEAAQALAAFRPDVIVPVVGISGLYGLILLGPRVTEPDYSDADLSYVDRLMRFVAIAIQNAIHYQNSVVDLKTGLYNHSFFTRRVAEELARVRRHGGAFSVLIFDLDRFKRLNDQYGHLAGDAVLVALAGVINDAIRTGDIASRFGGEEFSVLLVGAGKPDAFRVAERIRRRVGEMEVSHGDQVLRVTASVGATTVSGLGAVPVSPEAVITEADAALYQSKNRGRNRTTVSRAGLLLSTLARLEAGDEPPVQATPTVMPPR